LQFTYELKLKTANKKTHQLLAVRVCTAVRLVLQSADRQVQLNCLQTTDKRQSIIMSSRPT